MPLTARTGRPGIAALACGSLPNAVPLLRGGPRDAAADFFRRRPKAGPANSVPADGTSGRLAPASAYLRSSRSRSSGSIPIAAARRLHRSKGEVAFAAFDAAHVGAVHAETVSECFLAQAPVLPVAAEVRAEPPLQVAFHDGFDAAGLLLYGLQTYR